MMVQSQALAHRAAAHVRIFLYATPSATSHTIHTPYIHAHTSMPHTRRTHTRRTHSGVAVHETPVHSPHYTPLSSSVSSTGNSSSHSVIGGGIGQTYSASFYDTAWERYAERPLRRVRIRDLLRFGQQIEGNETLLLEGARFVCDEVTMRLAHRIRDIHHLPFIAGYSPQMQRIYETYMNTFHTFRKVPKIRTMADHDKFIEVLGRITKGNEKMFPMIAASVAELSPHLTTDELNTFLDTLLLTRIGRRLLIENHMALYSQYLGETPQDPHVTGTMVGILDPQCHIANITRATLESVEEWSVATYGSAPSYEIDGHTDATMTYVPDHIRYIIMELLKNSTRTCMDANANNGHDSRIRITIGKGDRDISLRVSDNSGGVSDEDVRDMWDYATGTLRCTSFENNANPGENKTFGILGRRNEIAQSARTHTNAGIGMPLTRLYASYFGGSLRVTSMMGHGTDVVLKLNHIGDHIELVPTEASQNPILS